MTWAEPVASGESRRTMLPGCSLDAAAPEVLTVVGMSRTSLSTFPSDAASAAESLTSAQSSALILGKLVVHAAAVSAH